MSSSRAKGLKIVFLQDFKGILNPENACYGLGQNSRLLAAYIKMKYSKLLFFQSSEIDANRVMCQGKQMDGKFWRMGL